MEATIGNLEINIAHADSALERLHHQLHIAKTKEEENLKNIREKTRRLQEMIKTDRMYHTEHSRDARKLTHALLSKSGGAVKNYGTQGTQQMVPEGDDESLNRDPEEYKQIGSGEV